MSMTESEAKYYLLEHKPIVGFKTHNEALDVAIQALSEVEQYRAIGTVEELKSMKENGSFSGVELAQIAIQLNELKEYKKIGTLERFRELTEKAEPKKQGNVYDLESHFRLSKAGFLCCGATNKEIRYPLFSLRDLEYCPRCGQRLDWE